MKILHYSDKGSEDFLSLYSQCDLLITTGDLRFRDFAGFDAFPKDKPAFGIYGNHDDGCNYLENNGIENVHNKIVDLNGLKIGGFQGCPKYNTREMQYTEKEAQAFTDNFPYFDILLLHAGPYGLLDDPSDPVHVGSKHIRRYVEEKSPRFVFCGHQYSNDETEYNSIKLFRTYGARIIEINT